MFSKLKRFLILVVLVALGGTYFLWQGMTPGEQHHLKDHADRAVKTGDFKILGDAVGFKVKEEMKTEKSKAADKAKNLQLELTRKAQDAVKKLSSSLETHERKLTQPQKSAPDSKGP